MALSARSCRQTPVAVGGAVLCARQACSGRNGQRIQTIQSLLSKRLPPTFLSQHQPRHQQADLEYLTSPLPPLPCIREVVTEQDTPPTPSGQHTAAPLDAKVKRDKRLPKETKLRAFTQGFRE